MDIWIAFRKIDWSLMLVLQGEIMWHWLLSTVCSISILAERHGWKCTHEVHWNRKQNGLLPFDMIFLRRWKWKEVSHLCCSDLVMALMHRGNLRVSHLSVVKYVWKKWKWHIAVIQIMLSQICSYGFSQLAKFCRSHRISAHMAA